MLIRTYRDADHPAYDALNRAWLVQYGLLEPPDEAQLADPRRYILDPGGEIFVAEIDGAVVGTCALMAGPGADFTLAKLGVDASARGRGVGRALVDACVGMARARGAAKVVLFSNSQLVSALLLYRGLGFMPAPLPDDVHYVSADVYLELPLTPLPG